MIQTPRVSVLIRGTGLLGASIGLGLRAAGWQVWLEDPSPTAAAIAEDIGAGTRVTTVADPESLTPDLVVIAAPPEVTAVEVARALTDFPGAAVVDIASVKAAIASDVWAQAHDPAQPLTREDMTRYVGRSPRASP